MTVQSRALAAALTQIGVPYVFGGENPKGSAHPGFDCSGLTAWSYAQAGMTLPHSSILQWQQQPKVDVAKPGDIVFFLGSPPGTPNTPGHCGICRTSPVNNDVGTMVQAEQTGTNVMISNFSTNTLEYVGAVRPVPTPVPWPGQYLNYPPCTTGKNVSMWQSRMNSQWMYRLSVDGVYGPLSKAACENFQRNHGLVVDGIVGKLTWMETFA